jgi:hypothetical protein
MTRTEIDSAMNIATTKAEFIAKMERMGYDVKWETRYKYITYTTPENQKCRDNRLHDEKYLKERMEAYYGYSQIKSSEQAGELNRGIQSESAALRNPAGGAEQFDADAIGNRPISNSDVQPNRGTSDVDGLARRDSADRGKDDSRTYNRGQQASDSTGAPMSDRDEFDESNDYGHSGAETERSGNTVAGSRQLGHKTPAEVARNRSVRAADIMGIAVALENLVVIPQREEERQQQKQQHIVKKRRIKKLQHSRDEWEMSM